MCVLPVELNRNEILFIIFFNFAEPVVWLLRDKNHEPDIGIVNIYRINIRYMIKCMFALPMYLCNRSYNLESSFSVLWFVEFVNFFWNIGLF